MCKRNVLRVLDPPITHPRNRLLRHGPESLTDSELLAVLAGRDGESVAMAERVDQLGSLAKLFRSDVRGLRRLGLDDEQIVPLSAAGELAKRSLRIDLQDRQLLDCPEALSKYVYLRYFLEDQEVMGAFFVDLQNRLIGDAEIFRGTLMHIHVEPRAVLRHALTRRAAGILLFHTHPGGTPDPSPKDFEFTALMMAACGLVGVRLAEHLVVGAEGAWKSVLHRDRVPAELANASR